MVFYGPDAILTMYKQGLTGVHQGDERETRCGFFTHPHWVQHRWDPYKPSLNPSLPNHHADGKVFDNGFYIYTI